MDKPNQNCPNNPESTATPHLLPDYSILVPMLCVQAYTSGEPVTTTAKVYEGNNGWLQISGSQSHWVSGRFTQNVQRATVTANTLNIRRGPGTHFDRAGSITKNEEVFPSISIFYGISSFPLAYFAKRPFSSGCT
jgi:hypothetical protein